jgi:hypothetical protein
VSELKSAALESPLKSVILFAVSGSRKAARRRQVGLVVSADGKLTFEWSQTASEWEDTISLVEGLWEAGKHGKSGHQYLTDESGGGVLVGPGQFRARRRYRAVLLDRLPQLKLGFRALCIVAAVWLTSCNGWFLPTPKEAEIVGTYKFEESLLGSKHGVETLSLKSDGTYMQTYLAPADSLGTTNTGTWRYIIADRGGIVSLADLRSWGLDLWGVGPTSEDYKGVANLNVERWRGTIRLVINEDAGQYFVRQK